MSFMDERRAPAPSKEPRHICLAIVGDCRGDRRRIAKLSEYLHRSPVSVDAILVVGLLGPSGDDGCDSATHPNREGDASATLAAIENISPRVFYAPTRHDPPSLTPARCAGHSDRPAGGLSGLRVWSGQETNSAMVQKPAQLSTHSMNVLAQPIRLADDFVLSSALQGVQTPAPVQPPSWCRALSLRLRRPQPEAEECTVAAVHICSYDHVPSDCAAPLIVMSGDDASEMYTSGDRIVRAGSLTENDEFKVVHMERSDCGGRPCAAAKGPCPWVVTRIEKSSIAPSAGMSLTKYEISRAGTGVAP